MWISKPSAAGPAVNQNRLPAITSVAERIISSDVPEPFRSEVLATAQALGKQRRQRA